MDLPFKEAVIIIPTYNESENVEKMISTLFSLYPEISILIIEDGSPDGTADIVKKLIKEHKNLYIIERQGKLGLGTAYLTGFKWALDRGYEYIFEMDCDFSHDPKYVANLLEAAQENDLVIGSRYIDGIRIVNWPFKRLLLSYFASIYIRLMTQIPILDATGGFKCFRYKTLKALDFSSVMSHGYGFQFEINYKVFCKGFKVKELPIIFYERTVGESKMGGNIIFEAFFNVLILRMKKAFGTL